MKGQTIIILLFSAVLVMSFFSSATASASTDSRSLLIRARIDKVAKLIVDSDTITFPSMDPDEAKQVPALQNDVKVTVKARTGSASPVTLHVIADGDLVSGADVIPVQNVTWQALGSGFVGGTLSKGVSQTAGAWTGSGVRQGTFRYFLSNSWNYQKGDYQVTVTYTLTAP